MTHQSYYTQVISLARRHDALWLKKLSHFRISLNRIENPSMTLDFASHLSVEEALENDNVVLYILYVT